MPQSLVQVYLHLVFSTKDRQPFLRDEKLRTELHAYMAGTCNNQGVDSLQVGGVEDHVHLCCRLSKTLAVSHLIAELKRESSKWIKPRRKTSVGFTGNAVMAHSPLVRRTLMVSWITLGDRKSTTNKNRSKTSFEGCVRNTI